MRFNAKGESARSATHHEMQQDYEQMAQRLNQEFMLERNKLNMEMEDTIKVRLKEFNKTRGYQLILSNTGTLKIFNLPMKNMM